MAEAFILRILDLIAELLAHTFGIRRTLKPARTVPAGALKTFPDCFDYFRIGIFRNSHLLILSISYMAILFLLI